MLKIAFLGLLAAFGANGAGVATPFPSGNFPYWGKVSIWGTHHGVRTLKEDAVEACRMVHRSLYALENYWEPIRQLMGDKGANFPVLYRNRSFYEAHLKNRFLGCTSGTLRFTLVGRCNTQQGTLAYVRVPFGVVIPIINVCDEFFALDAGNRAATLAHEYGRLENIGDSPNFDTDNIYVWDAILGRLSDPATFTKLGEMQSF